MGESPSTKPTQENAKLYWRANIIVVTILLAIWFVSSFVLAIILVEPLNEIQVGGFPFGFWMGQQGAIYIFIVLILVYALIMRHLDRKFGVDEEIEESGNEVPTEDL
ncbi:MAG: DUF4212 domain-containing protein [Verrucomicrobiota bacterium]